MRFRRTAGAKVVKERSAKDRKDPDVRSYGLLEKNHLELDRVFDGMTVVFHDDRITRVSRQAIDELNIHPGRAQRRAIRLSRQAELLRQTVMRGSENDERFAREIGSETLVCLGV